MSNVDNEIVNMEFNNGSFQKGVAATLSSLQKLKNAISFGKQKNELSGLQGSASKFSLNNMANQTQRVTHGFNAMRTAGLIAFATIVHQAVYAGEHLAAAFTIDPIKAGFQSYETQINAVQTILANTASEGTKLKDVTGALKELQTYANQTVYNFADMARNIGTFTAAGVNLKTSVSSIKGIANLAAMSGSNSQQASTAMYQLSQAIASGTVKLQDWNSVVNAGMGGKTFQTALINTARASGVAIDSIIKKSGSFRASLQQGWLTSGILTKTLDQFTGDLSKSQIKAMGFTDAEAKKIMAQGKVATDSATKIKTLSQLTEALKEEVATAWGEVFKNIFGNINQAKSLFSAAHTVMENALTKPIYSLAKLIKGFTDLGGRKVAIDVIVNAFHALGAVLAPIKAAFREVFPAKTAQDLLNFAKGLRDFTGSLMISKTTAEGLKRTFAGVFAAFDIGWQVIKGLGKVILDLFRSAGGASGGILSITGSIGDFLVAIDKAIKNGGLLNGFFTGLEHILRIPIRLFSSVAHVVAGLFKGWSERDANGVTNSLDRISRGMSGFSRAGAKIRGVFSSIGNILSKAAQMIGHIGVVIGHALGAVGHAIDTALNSNDFSQILKVLNAALIGGVLVIIRRFIKQGSTLTGQLNVDATGGMMSNIKEAFGELTNTMKTMQTQIQANTLMKIAGAIALLTASVVALSLIDPKKLGKALSGMAVAFGELLGAMAVLIRISGSAAMVKVPLMAASMVLLAGALLILTSAVAIMSRLSWKSIAKGLTGVAGSMVIMSVAMDTLPKVPTTGILAFAVLSASLLSISTSMAILGALSWSGIAKGLIGMAGAMTIVIVAMDSATGGLAGAAAMLIISPALIAFATSMSILGSMDGKAIGKALLGMAGGLTVLALALTGMDAALPGAAAMLVVAPGLIAMAIAMRIMGKLSWSAVAKGVVAMAGALTVLALGLTAMIIALPGALALTVAAKGLAALSLVLAGLGQLSWGTILKGLAALALTFAVLGAASIPLALAVIPLMGLGAALVLIGAGLALAGAGALAFATAFGIFIGAGTAGLTLVKNYFTTIIGQLPNFLKQLGTGLVAFVTAVAANAPKMVGALAKIMGSLLDAVIKTAPKMGHAFSVMMQTGLAILVQNAPRMANAGVRVMVAFLTAVRNNIGKITGLATDIILRFINKIGAELPRIANAGARLVIRFVNAVSTAIDHNSAAMGRAGGRLGMSIAHGMITGMLSMGGPVANAALSLAHKALGALHLGIGNPPFPSREGIKLGVSVATGFGQGLTDASNTAERAAAGLANNAMDTLRITMSKASSAVSDNLDINPTITPVLDLTKLTQDANKISGLVATDQLTAGVSYQSAKTISADQQAAAEASASASSSGTTEIKFEQNLYSPKELSPIDIYRQTRNQLSQAKEALKK